MDTDYQTPGNQSIEIPYKLTYLEQLDTGDKYLKCLPLCAYSWNIIWTLHPLLCSTKLLSAVHHNMLPKSG